MIDKITMPAIEVTPEEDGSIRFTQMGGHASAFGLMPRTAARALLSQLSIEIPEWLHPKNDDD